MLRTIFINGGHPDNGGNLRSRADRSLGNPYFADDGTTSQRIGNTEFCSNGQNCTTIGRQFYCN